MDAFNRRARRGPKGDPAGAKTAGDSRFAGKRVLIVDRDAETFALCQAALAPQGFVLESHNNAVAAFSAARQDPPDLIVIATQLGDASGFEVVDWIRSTPKLAAVQVIALTAMEDDHARLAASGVSIVLRKPLTIASVLRAVRDSLAHARASGPFGQPPTG
jgi:DNA-binding response OmpR family regulator